jgi:CDP-glycerol glycerophosphotransferase (TagB/SpsB family)
LDEYKETEGLLYQDYENWIPSELIRDQERFFVLLPKILQDGKDPYEEKRKILKEKFFTFPNAKSTERLVKHMFSKETKN